MSENQSREPDANRWEVQNLQLIVFPQKPSLELGPNWWHQVTKFEPDDFSCNKTRHNREDKGTFDGIVLSMFSDMIKVAWSVNPPMDFGGPPNGMPVIGEFEERLEWFKRLLMPWLTTSCPDIQRIGFACHLLRPSDSREQTYDLLSQYLHNVRVDQDSHDFHYRINRKRTYQLLQESIEINRLSTWSAVKAIFFPAQLNVAAGSLVPSNGGLVERRAASLTLDINSDAERIQALPKQGLCDLFDHLLSLANEIAVRGDVP